MDWHLNPSGRAFYRATQLFTILVLVVSGGSPVSLSTALECSAVLVIASIVRLVGGTFAAAAILICLQFDPAIIRLGKGSMAATTEFLFLALLLWLLVRWGSVQTIAAWWLPSALAAVIAALCYIDPTFLLLGPVVAFALLLLRYVPAGATTPYTTLAHAFRRSQAALRDVMVIAIASALVAGPVWRRAFAMMIQLWTLVREYPSGYAVAVATDTLKSLSLPQRHASFEQVLHPYQSLVLVGSLITIWWFWESIREGSGIPFTLSAIPITVLVLHSLMLQSGDWYEFAVRAVVLANLFVILSLWMKGRMNKRMLDSTRN